MALQSFCAFKKDHQYIKLVRSEKELTSLKHSFNGTIDCTAELDGQLILADWKTAAAKEKEKPTIYDEYLYQVAAYVYLYNEINGTNINKAIIVSIAKDKVAYNTHIMDKEEIEGCFNEVFLSALKILTYQKKEK